jgi:hypothetical protein
VKLCNGCLGEWNCVALEKKLATLMGLLGAAGVAHSLRFWVSSPMSKTLAWLAVAAGLVIAAALCVIAYQGVRAHDVPTLSTPYQTVALVNGQAFFGRIESLDGSYVVLRDVFYIQSRQNPETKDIANVLIKRGGEAHAPDRMIINRQQVLLIEPVGGDSKIAKLIAEQAQAR